MKLSMAIIVQALFWVASVAFAAGTYFHTQATVNQRVEKVENSSALNSQILCHMAIDFKIKKAKDICTRLIFKP